MKLSTVTMLASLMVATAASAYGQTSAGVSAGAPAWFHLPRIMCPFAMWCGPIPVPMPRPPLPTPPPFYCPPNAICAPLPPQYPLPAAKPN